MRYVIFGAGRVGANIAAYLRALGHHVALLSHDDVCRNRTSCAEKVAGADIVAAAIPDDHLAAWRNEWSMEIGARQAIHFSGAATIKGVASFHPLFSFPETQVPIDVMKTIAFACPTDGPAFRDVFPGADNPHFEIGDKLRARYHALAVLIGNLPAFVWNEAGTDLSKLSGLSPEAAMGAYLQSLVDRFLESPAASMTGPIARKDRKTVAANLEALNETPLLKALYDAFLDAAWPDYRD